jgi:LacI family transcriptional regulator
MATINDVAALAGVSVATVSRALNGKATVAPELVARVRAAATELHYHPNGLARSLRSQQTAVLALIISDVANPFFTSVARGVEDIALAAGYSVVLCNSDENVGKENRYLSVAIEERVAGVVLSPTGAGANIDVLRARSTPVVAVDRPLPGIDQVLVNSRAAAAAATRHLLSSGYQRVGCVTGPAGMWTADDRLAGYRDALAEMGAQSSPEWERRAEYQTENGRIATADLLAANDQLDALLIGNSSQAAGALQVIRSIGRRPGRDIGVVAFDDSPWATLVDPPLSVVAQPAYELGALAAELLLQRIRNTHRGMSAHPAPRPVVRTLEAQLIERGSSCRV